MTKFHSFLLLLGSYTKSFMSVRWFGAEKWFVKLEQVLEGVHPKCLSALHNYLCINKIKDTKLSLIPCWQLCIWINEEICDGVVVVAIVHSLHRLMLKVNSRSFLTGPLYMPAWHPPLLHDPQPYQDFFTICLFDLGKSKIRKIRCWWTLALHTGVAILFKAYTMCLYCCFLFPMQTKQNNNNSRTDEWHKWHWHIWNLAW